jgi:hypothetical protein
MGICNTYLAHGAYGFFGSSTIAYGPADANGSADLICQYFLKHVFAGASLGRAALQARQDFVGGATQLDPFDEKTLAQFNLMADPSIHPVSPAPPSVAVAPKLAKAIGPQLLALLTGRADRRRQLEAAGESLASAASFAVKAVRRKVGAGVKRTLRQLAKEARLPMDTLRTFSVRGPRSAPLRKSLAAKVARTTAFHVLFGDGPPADAPIIRVRALIAKEQDGRIVSYEEVHSR